MPRAKPSDDLSAARLNRLFVYGTLMPGRLRWPLLAPHAVGHRLAEVPGALFDSGNGWPVAVFGDAGTVPGTVVELDPAILDELLPVIDEVEDTVGGAFERVVVTTTDGETAWAYRYLHDVSPMTRIAVWDRADER